MLLALVLSLATGVSATATSGAGRVTAISGVTNVRPGQLVSAGKRLTTGRNGQIVLVFANGHRLRIGPNTNMVLVTHQPQQKRTLLAVNQGRVWNQVKPKSGNQVVVRTRHSTATVMGTSYDILVSDAETQTTVFQGSVGVKRSEPELPKNIFEALPDLSQPVSQPVETSGAFQAPTEVQTQVHEVSVPLLAVPGPYQVSMDDWLQIVENQQITIGAAGRAQVREIDPVALQDVDAWYRWNLERDLTEDK